MAKCKVNKYRGTKIYNIWLMMRQRCNNENHFAYKWYGARGIKVCDEWDNSQLFCDWAMNNGYEEGLELDRINNDGDYSPDNCQWISHYNNCGIGKRRSLKNTSGYIGVWYDSSKSKWRAEIYKDYKKIKVGTFSTIEEAVECRIDKEIEIYGEQKTNFHYNKIG